MKITFHKNPDGTIYTVKDHNNKAPGLLRVFVGDHRPNGEKRPGVGDIAADLAWRRSVKMTDVKKNPDFKKAILDYMQKTEADVVFRFNRNCGCAMCPCSPGILVQDATQKYQPANVNEIWVDIFNDDQDPDAILAAEKLAREEANAKYELEKKVAEEAAAIAAIAPKDPEPVAEPVPEVVAPVATEVVPAAVALEVPPEVI
jgi:hypothetical protein